MRIWLDDSRPKPEIFDAVAKTASEGIELVRSGKVTFMSFDHDLGDGNGTGYDVAKVVEELAYHGKIPPIRFAIHSANPVGRKNIKDALLRALDYWKCHHK